MSCIQRDTAGIKLEAVLSVEEEEALVARGWSKPGKGCGGTSKRGNGSKTSGGKSSDERKED